MFHYNVFIALAIVASVLTNPIVNPPNRCCFPDRYSYTTDYIFNHTLFDGTPSTVHMQYNFAYDAERGFLATRGIRKSEPNNFETSFWSVYNLRNGDHYTFESAMNICVKTPNIVYREHCIEESAIYANSSMDTYDFKETLVDTWIVQDNDFVSYQQVRHDDCMPLKSGYSMPGHGLNTRIINTNIRKDIADPSIFEIPSSCH